MIKVIQPGLFTTVQDEGRIGYYAKGFPPSGALDSFSYKIANLLVGNFNNAAALEITYMGPELEFKDNYIISLTGGNMPSRLNGDEVPMWESFEVKRGDILTFDFIKEGARVYLAIQGGIKVPSVLNSKSTHTLSKTGGYEGRTLQAGDLIKIGNEIDKKVQSGVKLSEKFIPNYKGSTEVRIVDGLCSYRITEESKHELNNVEWTITPDANRVGYRIKGGSLDFIEREQPFGAGASQSNVVDVGYPVGSLQLPDSSEPIVLLKDAVTCGGYATIGTVISSDLHHIAQLKTHNKLKFKYVTIEEALEARIESKNHFIEIEKSIRNQ